MSNFIISLIAGSTEYKQTSSSLTYEEISTDSQACNLQIADTCEAGASALTAVYSVLSKGDNQDFPVQTM